MNGGFAASTIPSPSAAAIEYSPISPAQLAANRANAQLSTGPRTPEGLTRSSRNAVKSGLTGRTVLLPTDDVNEYANFLAGFGRDLKPVGQAESELVQIIVDCFWRLRRLQALEYALHVHAHEQFADAFPDCPAEDRYSKILLQSCMTYEKHLRNCHIQEARLERKRIKAMNELQRLQAERKENEPSSQNQSAGEELAAASPTTRAKEEVEANGFVFSNAHEPAHSAALDRPITNWKAA